MAHHIKLHERLTEFRANGTFCDYVMVAGNERISVHKVIMAACSDYFYAMVTSDMKERGENTITLEAVDGTGLRAVVDFAYYREVTIDQNNVESILQAASYLQVQDLVEQCEANLRDIIKPDNCVLLTPLIESYGIDKKYPDIANFIFYNFHDIPNEHYNLLSLEQLIAILSDDRLKLRSESCLVKIVKDWMISNKHCVFDCPPEDIHPEEEPWVTFTLLMSEIRWCLLSEDDLHNLDEEVQSAMDAIPTCREFLVEAKRYHADIYRQPLMQNSRTRVRCDSMQMVIMTENNSFSPNVYETFDITGLAWDTHQIIEQNPYNNITNQKAVSFNNFLFICGGDNVTDYKTSNLCARYDPRFNKWQNMASMNYGRNDFVLVTHGNSLYVVGGRKATIPRLSLETISTCEIYDIEANAWRIIPEYNSGIADHAGCVVGHDIYISGGYKRHENQCNTEVYRYNVPMGRWLLCAPMRYSRLRHIMKGIGKVIYVIGGLQTSTIERYSIEADQWTKCKQTISVGHKFGSFVNDSKIFILRQTVMSNKAILIFSEESDDIVQEKSISIHGSVENFNGSTVLSIPFHMQSDIQVPFYENGDMNSYYDCEGNIQHAFDDEDWEGNIQHEFDDYGWEGNIQHEFDDYGWEGNIQHEFDDYGWEGNIQHEFDDYEGW